MAFTKTFPYDIGTFVVVDLDTYDENDPKQLINRLGIITCYHCTNEDDELVAMVSGYKSAWAGAYLLSEIRLATDLEVTTYRNIIRINNECEDCKYYTNNKCTHPHSMHCKHCELWAPKWY